MRDKKGTVAETAAMGGFEARRGVGRRAEETHRRRDDKSSSSRAAAQKSTPIDKNFATMTITHLRTSPTASSTRRTFRAISSLPPVERNIPFHPGAFQRRHRLPQEPRRQREVGPDRRRH